jgi:hypothetical protein
MGFWLASALAAYLGSPAWMAWAAGALLFPIIPGVWEFYDWTHRDPGKKAWFNTFDRLSFRTFGLGLAFIAVLLCLYPQTAFVSLSTRGDWMLDGVKDPRADKARHILFTAANGLEWLYHATKTNPYDTQIDPKARLAEEQAAAQRDQDLAKQQAQDLSQRSEDDTKSGVEKVAEENGTDTTQTGDNDTSQQPENETSKQPENETSKQPGKKVVADHENEFAKPVNLDPVWPWKQTGLHPAVASMPASAETSIKSVAQYIAKHERDPVKRIKALHDYVADRIAYDSEALYSGKFPDQDAETTFRTHKSVCAGYANLLSALGRAINEQIVVVTGNARDRMSANKLSGWVTLGTRRA